MPATTTPTVPAAHAAHADRWIEAFGEGMREALAARWTPATLAEYLEDCERNPLTNPDAARVADDDGHRAGLQHGVDLGVLERRTDGIWISSASYHADDHDSISRAISAGLVDVGTSAPKLALLVTDAGLEALEAVAELRAAARSGSY